jgi:hypothetical protein
MPSTTHPSTTIRQIKGSTPFPISGIVGILVGSFIFIAVISFIVVRHRQAAQTELSTPDSDTSNPQERKSLSVTLHQYLITTRSRIQAARQSATYASHHPLPTKLQTHRSLIDSSHS